MTLYLGTVLFSIIRDYIPIKLIIQSHYQLGTGPLLRDDRESCIATIYRFKLLQVKGTYCLLCLISGLTRLSKDITPPKYRLKPFLFKQKVPIGHIAILRVDKAARWIVIFNGTQTFSFTKQKVPNVASLGLRVDTESKQLDSGLPTQTFSFQAKGTYSCND